MAKALNTTFVTSDRAAEQLYTAPNPDYFSGRYPTALEKMAFVIP